MTEERTPTVAGDNVSGSNPNNAVSARDIQAWTCVSEVTDYKVKNRSSITEACKALGWPRWSYYAYLQRPYVKSQMLAQMEATQAETWNRLREGWADVIGAQIAIASDKGGDKRASTAAARFLQSEYSRLREDVREEGGKVSGKKTRAQEALDRLLGAGGGKVTTTVEVEPPMRNVTPG